MSCPRRRSCSLPERRRIDHGFTIKYLMLVALVAALPNTTWAIDVDCGLLLDLGTGTTFEIYNPGFPNSYTGSTSCRWHVRSATNVYVRLTCQTFSLPATPYCAGDRLAVSPSGDFETGDGHSFCATGPVNITSTGNSMKIILNGSIGGKFSCTLETIATTAPTCDCGQKKLTRILGGEETDVNEYPMMAALINNRRKIVDCGATIISTKHVLSAAHCKTSANLSVLVGEHVISTGLNTAAASLHPIASFVRHPSYNPSTSANDIAVITVTDSIIFTTEVGPACLPFQTSFASFAGSKVDVVGWGFLDGSGPRPKVLQKVQLDVIQRSSCQTSFPIVTTNQVCTYTPGKDACGHDSGGPLLWQNPVTMRLVLAGVVSYGAICDADNRKASVNTRVGAYLNWILSVTPGVDYCRVE